MTTPTSPHVCVEVHPNESHFIWIATAKKLEIEQREAQTNLAIQPVILTDEESDYYAQFAVELDEDDHKASGFTDYQARVNSATESVTFEEVFRALLACGKIWKTEWPLSSWKADSNKFMCPDPSHDNPGAQSFSAWGSAQKGIWTCTKGCGSGRGGGDKFTLASYLFDEWDFHKVANLMAKHFRGVSEPALAPPAPPPPALPVGGIPRPRLPEASPRVQTVQAGLSRTESITTEHSLEAGLSENYSSAQDGSVQEVNGGNYSWSSGAVVVSEVQAVEGADNIQRHLVIGSEDDDETGPVDNIPIPYLPWREILALNPNQDTFMHRYCNITSADTVPDEFNFFNSLLAVGMALGNKVTSPDQQTLSMNLGVCLVVQSGGGKSRSIRHLTTVLQAADPYNETTGSRIITSPNSGQYLVHSFCKVELLDDGSFVSVPVKGLVHFDELSEMMKASGNMGSILKDKVHALLDHNSTVEYASLAQKRMVAIDPFASVITATQTGKLKELLTREDATAGFLNRFLFVLGNAKRQISRGKVQVDLTPAVEALRNMRVRYYLTESLDWSFEADDYFDSMFHNQIEVMKKFDRKDMLTRLDLNIKRLIIIFAANDHAKQVEVHHVKMAELLLDYLVKCYGGVIARIVETKTNEMGDWLLKRIATLESRNYYSKMELWQQENPDIPFAVEHAGDYGVKQSDLKREYRQKDWDDTEVRKALDELVKSRQIEEKPSTNLRGRKTTYFHLTEEYKELAS